MSDKHLRHEAGRIELLERLLQRRSRSTREVAAATATLVTDHPLVRTLDALSALRRQLAATSLTIAAAVVALALDIPQAAALIVAASAVELLLGSTVLALRSRQRTNARELIADGRGHIPLRAIVRERQRLSRPRTQRALAHCLVGLLDAAAHWPRILRTARPVFDVRLILAAAPQLTEIARLLYDGPTPPEAVARLERLLTDGNSPLYGHDRLELRSELEVIRRGLQQDF